MSKTVTAAIKLRLNCLNKRIKFLQERIAHSNKQCGYEKEELEALSWALKVVEKSPEQARQAAYEMHKPKWWGKKAALNKIEKELDKITAEPFDDRTVNRITAKVRDEVYRMEDDPYYDENLGVVQG